MFSKKFICAGTEYNTWDKNVAAPYMRKSFDIAGDVKSASVTICGLGFYELYINGTNVTKGFVAPYVSNPDDLLYYDTCDIAPYLKKGENVIGIILGNGQLNNPGGAVWDFQLAVYRSAPKTAFSCEIENADGSKVSFEADESVICHPSPIYFDDLRSGEFYDARNEVPGWNMPGIDTSDWTPAMPAETPRGECVVCGSEPIKILEELKPVSFGPGKLGPLPSTTPILKTYEMDEIEGSTEGYLYDFGVNTTGLPKLKIKAEKGQKIVLQVGETLNSLGELDIRTMQFQPHKYNQRDIYIAKGEGIEEFMPRFTYQGFRYVLVLGITAAQATEDLLRFEVMSTAFGVSGEFKTSDKMLQAIQDAVVVSDRSNFFYFPLDCPHREKNGWTGDAALSAEQFLTNFACENALREWLRNIRKAQREDGALPGIIPTSGWGFAWGNGPVWDNALFEITYQLWRQRGDTDTIRANASAMMRYLNYMYSKRDAKGLLHFGLGDWCHAGRPGGEPKAPLEVTDTLMCLHICQNAVKMFSAIGLMPQAQFACTIGNEIRMAARRFLIEDDGKTVFGCCQTSQALGIYYDLFDRGEVAAAYDVLKKLIERDGGVMDVGVLGARVLYRVLALHGDADLAYSMITTTKYPSFGYWIANGATSMWEAFWPNEDQYYPASKNHHFWGDVSAFMTEFIAGLTVNPNDISPDEVLVRPNFVKGVNDASAYVTVPKGRVEVSWKRVGERIELSVTAPEGVYGNMILGSDFQFEDGRRNKNVATGTYTLLTANEMDHLTMGSTHFN